jgi:predicted dithiol-disulfide oxidoreductase (DUF899 family)
MSAQASDQHDGMSFPGKSDEYRQARNRLLAAEADLRRQIEAVAELRRGLPSGGEPPTEYEFQEWDPAACAGRTVRLPDLFTVGQDTLFLYSFMFNPDPSGQPLTVACPLCTSMLDGLDSELPHLTQRISFAAVAKAPIERFHAHAHTRR